MRHSEFLDERSNVLFVLSYMKGGTAGPWATQRINSILYPSEAEEVTWAGFVEELDEMFADPNHQATARRKLATLCQGDSSVEELIQEFEIHGPISGLGNVGLVDRFEQAIHPCLRESIYRRQGWIACSKRSTRPTLPSPEMGPWISNSRISSSTGLSPWRKVASFLLAVAWQFRSANISLSSSTNLAHVTSCASKRMELIFCVAQGPADPPFI